MTVQQQFKNTTKVHVVLTLLEALLVTR